MSALTTAMTPWQHELSQMLGQATHIIAGPEDTGRQVMHQISLLVDAVERELAHTDAVIEEVAAEVGYPLANWKKENEWNFYELTEKGWVA